jgi:(1->4)-alpha-D-glucan 1-alpha-D-glucosylmutase
MQFNKYFTFKDATQQIAYLRELGITDLYASPYFLASPDSLHGYDVCDYNQFNPSIGTREDYQKMSEELKHHGLNQLLDIVPNHMGITETCNKWWMDVLENGPNSIYAGFFDIDWKPVKDELAYKVLIPILGDQYGNVLDRGELQIKFVASEGAFYLDYWEHRQPINPRTYPMILKLALDMVQPQLDESRESILELQSIISNFGYLPPRWETDYQKVMERNREKEILKKRLANLCSGSTQVLLATRAAVASLNGTPGNSESFDQLAALIDAQAFRPAYWRVAADEINYRRFFDINELAAIRIEKPEVYQKSHSLIFELIGEGHLQGLRVDHADGLWDPAGYLWNLQCTYFTNLARQQSKLVLGREVSNEEWASFERGIQLLLAEEREKNPASPLLTSLYVVTEKILGVGEPLPANWTVAGTSGYDFLNQVNGLFVDSASESAIEDLYTRFITIKWRYGDLVYSRKAQISLTSLASEVNVLARLLSRIAEQDRHFQDFTLNNLRLAIREIIACFPVYRTYTVAETGQVEKRDQIYIERAIAAAKRRNPASDILVFDFIRELLLLNLTKNASEVQKAMQLDFVMKFQQVTGPIMAKGLEDTTFYLYNRLTSLNEVGGEPSQFGQSVEAFHRQNQERLKSWPNALLTTSTHDTKRSEDVRSRINVLSEMPQEWRVAINRWTRFNEHHRTDLDGKLAPDRNDEYLLYQTLIGVWPFYEAGDSNYANFIERIQTYMIKAMREAKFNTSWLNPNQAYEGAVHDFVAGVLSRSKTNLFLKDFRKFQAKTTYFGMYNSLAQLLLKITAPGVPDFYQGNELWDLSLVDPDNRRIVDYGLRRQLLAQLPRPDESQGLQELLANKKDGRIKLYLIKQALHFRNGHRQLFDRGNYQALNAEGPKSGHICAFERKIDGNSAITVVPRLLYRMTKGNLEEAHWPAYWQGTALKIAGEATRIRYRNIFTNDLVEPVMGEDHSYLLPLEKVLANFPVALLECITD